MNLRRILATGLSLIALLSAAPARAAGDDPAAIRHALMAQFDKPEARLQVEPVVVVGDAAIAGWAQGERGGRALLFRKGSQWQIALCAGDGLKGVPLLREAGIAAGDAELLAQELAKAEARLTPAYLAKLGSFDGLVRMDASGQHPPAHSHKH